MRIFLVLFQALVLITGPVEGQVVSGVVNITGTAASPQFDHFTIAFGYDPNPTDTWFEIAPPVTTQVTSDLLASWDTTGITDGNYMLRLQVFSTNSQTPVEVIVRNIKVSNNSPLQTTSPAASGTQAGPISLSTPPLNPTAELTQAAPTLAPQSTSPAATAVLDLTPTTEAAVIPLPAFLDLSSYTSSFCNGVYLTAAVFLVIGLYATLRDRIRRPIRRWLRRIVSDSRKP